MHVSEEKSYAETGKKAWRKGSNVHHVCVSGLKQLDALFQLSNVFLDALNLNPE